MHVSFASLIIIALSATTMFAADTAPTGPPSLLPVCGANCAKSVAPRTSCKDVGNITCQCSDQNYSTLMNLCILANCSSQLDRNETLAFGHFFCKTSVSGGSEGSGGDQSPGSNGSQTPDRLPSTSGAPTGTGNTTSDNSQGNTGSGGGATGTTNGSGSGSASAASLTEAVSLIASLGAVAIAFATLA